MAPSLETTNKLEAKYVNKQEEEEGFLIAIKLMSSMAVPMAIRTSIELGIFAVLSKAGEDAELSAQEIASVIGSNNPEAPTMLDRLMMLLASNSMLSCSLSNVEQEGDGVVASPKRLYSLTHASKYFVTDADGVSLAHILNLLLDKVYLESWTELKGAIMEGGVPFDRVHGMHAFEYPSVDPSFNDVFNKAMLSHTTMVMNRVLEFYEGFHNINRLVDVGGSFGISLKLITSKYPHIKGVNFDLPHVIEHAPSYAGVEHVGGDMFESIPNGDAIFMKWILHDWSDEQCLKILKNCHKAIPDYGKVIVVDAILPNLPESTTTAHIAFQADLLMMTMSPGGKERAKHEFMNLATNSGFGGIRFVCYVSGMCVMEFFK